MKGAVIETSHEYFSEITKDCMNERNGKATENARQTSKKKAYDEFPSNVILLAHLLNPGPKSDNIGRLEAQSQARLQLRRQQQ